MAEQPPQPWPSNRDRLAVGGSFRIQLSAKAQVDSVPGLFPLYSWPAVSVGAALRQGASPALVPNLQYKLRAPRNFPADPVSRPAASPVDRVPSARSPQREPSSRGLPSSGIG